MSDQGFPHIQYDLKATPLQRGQAHGEEFSKGIKKLSGIRRDLMLQKSPHLKSRLSELSLMQQKMTQDYSPELFKELEGIAQGSGASLEDLIILNNYTDFRDIQLPDEGCTSIALKRTESVSAQTWDMHSSAKDYICSIELPGHWCVFSLVGCLGMMGVNKSGLFIGVNNINTSDARAGVIWSSFVRKYLEKKSFKEASDLLKSTPFTSGHNYLLSDGEKFQHWEASPTKLAMASEINNENSLIFHTNHCLTQELIEIEEKLSQNSTSLDRYEILKSKSDQLQTADDVFELLQSHEGYPKSICGHFQSGALDPSITCGGAVYLHEKKSLKLWRGCPKEDDNYSERTITLN